MNIALVAHDKRKDELIEWVKFNLLELSKHELYATGTTGKLIQWLIDDTYDGLKTKHCLITNYGEQGKNLTWSNIDECLLNSLGNKKVHCLHSGLLGGDSEIGSMIAKEEVDCLIFFCDNLITQGHQQDVGALSRLASLYNIPFATNRTTADMIITSKLWNNKNYQRVIPDCIKQYAERKL